MRCAECGAKMKEDALFCPECGAAPDPRSASNGGCRRLFPLLWGMLALVLALGVLVLAAWRGVVEGKRQWQSNAEATADAEVARCNDYLSEGRWALAAAACRQANSLKPGISGAAEGYATAVAALTPEPTPTIVITQRSPEEIFSEAQGRFDNGDWQGAVEALNELWKFDASYRVDEAKAMRFTALVSLGQETLDAGRLEEAIYYLDQATELNPLDPELELERQQAARYVSALNYCGVDWDACTERLSDLYAAYPDYRDVYDRLVGSYLNWAEAMAGIQEWCPAEVHYGQALNLRPDPELEGKQADAAQRCLTATPTPIPGQITGTVTVTVEGFSVGRLAYAAYNPDLGVYELYSLSAYDQRLSRLASSATQPNWRRDGAMLLYRGAAGVQAVAASGGAPVTVLGDPTAFWPSFAPDGSRLAFARQEEAGWRIYTAPADGSAEPEPLVYGKYPLWGPQGALAFSGCLVDGTPRGVCVVDPYTPEAIPVPLTADPNDTPTSWSPDGGNISYMSNHGGDWDVYLVSTSGGVAVLTSDDEAPASDGLPAWAPDGSAIAFLSNREGTWKLYLMAPNGMDVRSLVELGAQHPNWLLERLAWGP
jgi:tetratricopeptide (TPR) repeat protein